MTDNEIVKQATDALLGELLKSFSRIGDELKMMRNMRQLEVEPLTLREQTAGSVFVGLVQAYYASNGLLSCSPATLRQIATEAWKAAGVFEEAGDQAADLDGVDLSLAGMPERIAPASSGGNPTLSDASPQVTDFKVDR